MKIHSISLSRQAVLAAIVAGALGIAGVAGAHHSFAMFDMTKTATIEGTVKDFQWTNPHVWIEMMVDTPAGPKQYSIETVNLHVLKRSGWKFNTLKPGDKVTLVMNPFRSGGPGGALVSAKLADGSTLSGNGGPPPGAGPGPGGPGPGGQVVQVQVVPAQVAHDDCPLFPYSSRWTGGRRGVCAAGRVGAARRRRDQTAACTGVFGALGAVPVRLTFDPSIKWGGLNKVVLQPEYDATYKARIAAMAKGEAEGKPLAGSSTLCLPVGTPGNMMAFAPLEIVTTEKTVYVFAEGWDPIAAHFPGRTQRSRRWTIWSPPLQAIR